MVEDTGSMHDPSYLAMSLLLCTFKMYGAGLVHNRYWWKLKKVREYCTDTIFVVVTKHLSCNTLASSLQTSVLCGMNTTKIPALQSDSVKVLSELTESNTVAVVVQNSLETTRYSPSSNVVVRVTLAVMMSVFVSQRHLYQDTFT